MITYHPVVLFVKDIEKAKKFYCDFLSIPVEMDMGANVMLRPGIALWEIREENIIVRTVGRANIGTGFKCELYFETDCLDETAAMLEKNKIKKLHDIHEEPWGQRTIRFFDDDMNIIEVGEKLEIFLDRLVKSGMAKDEIVGKTGMKIEDIEKSIGHKI